MALAYILFIILYVLYLPKDIANYGGCDNEGQSVAAAATATEAVAAASL